MRNLTTIIVVALFIMGKMLHAQDPQFSQFYASPLYLSPSHTGSAEHLRLAFNFRDQWPKLPNAYITYAMSADKYFEDYKSGLGMLVIREQEGGVYSFTSLGALYSYRIKLNREWNLVPGLKASYYNRNIDWNNLNFGDAIGRGASTIETPDYERVNFFDITSSVLVYSYFYWFGVTVDHMLGFNKQFADDPVYPSIKYTLHGGVKLHKRKIFLSEVDKSYSISFFYKEQAGVRQLDVGVNYEQELLRVGVWFRGIPLFGQETDLNAVILLMGYSFQKLHINYSYDISTSRLLSSTGGAHEVSFIYILRSDSRKRSKRGAVPCPKF